MNRIFVCTLVILIAGCAPYALKKPGENQAGPLQFETTSPWNKMTQYRPGKDVEVWTSDGQLLNSMMIFKGVADGNTLFRTLRKADPMPEFRTDMLPQEIVDLVVDSLTKHYGDGKVIMTAEALAPLMFADKQGFKFELSFTNENGLNYLGKCAAAVVDEELFMLIYTGTKLYYFDKHASEFEQIVGSMSL